VLDDVEFLSRLYDLDALPSTDRRCPRRYASMMAEDRDLRLKGYEVYRFGGAELTDTWQPASSSMRSFSVPSGAKSAR